MLCGSPCMVDRIFCESKGSSCGRSIVCGEGKSIFRISVYFFKSKMLPFNDDVVPCSQYSTWLITSSNGAYKDLGVGL